MQATNHHTEYDDAFCPCHTITTHNTVTGVTPLINPFDDLLNIFIGNVIF